MTLLIVYYALDFGVKSGKDILVVLGFFFSLLGDIFLIDAENYFIFGLVAFAIAHISYILALTLCIYIL